MSFVRAVLGHRMDDGAITYRVQWTNEMIAWVPGTEIDCEENQDILVAYWKNSDVQFKEQACQTNECYPIDFDEVANMLISRNVTNFVTFSPDQWSPVTDVTAPAEILGIDYQNEMAIVKYSRDTDPVKVSIETVKNTAPLLLAEFMVKEL